MSNISKVTKSMQERAELRNLRKSVALNTDSYKGSMYLQYPPGTEYVYSYVESRGGVYDRVVFMGLQPVIKEWLLTPITQEQIDFAEKVWTAHGFKFNRAGWQRILDVHGGLMPVVIKAVPEGTVVPTKNVLCTVENTDPELPWTTTWVETLILRAIWYMTTVATASWDMKQVIKAYLEKSGDVAGLPFKLHDFGARGVSSAESAELGGAAHLVNFLGTDTIAAIPFLMEMYDADLNTIGFSIPAAEHSTITSWGREREEDAYRNMVTQFGKKDAILAVVSDSYDIYKACEMWGTVLKDDVIKSGATVVIRPDSGDPIEVIPKMLKILMDKFGVTINDKGFRVLNHVRIIWGDGIDPVALKSILRTVVDVCNFSADNFAFGMGGGLLQKVDRDTQKFAMKCSAAYVEGKWIPVYKDPITDSGKTSKKGRVTLYKDHDGAFWSGVEDWPQSELVEVYRDGELLVNYTLEEVRANSNKPCVLKAPARKPIFEAIA